MTDFHWRFKDDLHAKETLLDDDFKYIIIKESDKEIVRQNILP
jgi:hypothetical protein